MQSIETTARSIVNDGAVLCIRLGEGTSVVEACRAAMRGGLSVLEVTLTTPGALAAIAELAREGALVGGGTVLCTDDVRAVAEAGGRFVLSPVFDPDVLEEAGRRGLLAVPGAATPTEILAAHRYGARMVKVFPAGALGGPDYLRAIRGPLPDVALLPTNGATAENLAAYFAAGAVAVGIGNEVFPPGFTLARVEAAARRVRGSLDAVRAGAGAGDVPAHATARIEPVPIGNATTQGVACRWEVGQYAAIVAPRGIVGCGIFDLAVCERFGFAVAMAHGTPESPLVTPADLLEARVDTVSARAKELGIEPGMTGRAALEKLL